MAKIQVCFENEDNRKNVVHLCRRLGRVKASDHAVVVKVHLPARKVILFLESQPGIVSARRIKNKAAP